MFCPAIADVSDNCQFTSNVGQDNNDGDSEGDLCDNDDDNDGKFMKRVIRHKFQKKP